MMMLMRFIIMIMLRTDAEKVTPVRERARRFYDGHSRLASVYSLLHLPTLEKIV